MDQETKLRTLNQEHMIRNQSLQNTELGTSIRKPICIRNPGLGNKAQNTKLETQVQESRLRTLNQKPRFGVQAQKQTNKQTNNHYSAEVKGETSSRSKEPRIREKSQEPKLKEPSFFKTISQEPRIREKSSEH